ncbi:MAG TPA: glycosyltransferase [Burkholderiaceae bacterium]|nr:glycosyltransferase [Burkholderiaceae bacterium]
MPVSPSRSTPARLTATATSKLPRIVLISVGIIYIFAGLFLRDPWKTDDVVGLATMLTALEGGSLYSWLLPHIGTLAHTEEGPLITWVGALSIWAFSPLFQLFVSPVDAAIIASRLPNLLWFAILCLSVWYGTYLLGRRPEPQPLALPFGGEPGVHDYGRMIADAALLLIVATIGIVWRMHETSAVPAIIAFQALAFYAVARMIDRPISGAVTLGIALGAAFLARGWIGAFPIVLASLLAFRPANGLWKQKQWLAVSAAIGLVMGLAWWLAARHVGQYWAYQWKLWHTDLIGLPNIRSVLSMLRDLPWFLWPTWPFALIAVWRWRDWISAPHIWVPLVYAVVPLVFMACLTDVFEPEFALLAVPSAVLASFALPTLRRGIVNSLDWFAVMCFSLTAATVWLGWVALQTGWPPKISNNIARQSAGYEIFVSWPAVIVAVLGTLSWFALVRWRLHNRPAALWRGTVLSAGGLIVTWLLLVTLWMPVLDYARSYRDVSAELHAVLQQYDRPNNCLRTLGVGTGQRASFLVFDNITFTFDLACPLVLQQTSPDAVRKGTVYTPAGARVIWEGKRRADRHEMFRLLHTGN